MSWDCFRNASLQLAPAVASCLALALAPVSHAGPPPPTPTPTSSPSPTPTPCPLSCHYNCSIDKKCSVDGGAPQDSCVASAGDEVTYSYHVDAGEPIGGVSIVVEVEDDKLGAIGQTSTGTLSRTTTLSETTTNTATITDLRLAGNYSCFLTGDFDDSVTVTVTTAAPTNSFDGSLSCDAAGCSGVVNAVEKYESVSQDGKDTDRMALLPN